MRLLRERERMEKEREEREKLLQPEEPNEEEAMMAMMGFSGFESTQDRIIKPRLHKIIINVLSFRISSSSRMFNLRTINPGPKGDKDDSLEKMTWNATNKIVAFSRPLIK